VQLKQVSEKAHERGDKRHLSQISDLTQDRLPSDNYNKKRSLDYLELGDLQHFLLEMGHNT